MDSGFSWIEFSTQPTQRAQRASLGSVVDCFDYLQNLRPQIADFRLQVAAVAAAGPDEVTGCVVSASAIAPLPRLARLM